MERKTRLKTYTSEKEVEKRERNLRFWRGAGLFFLIAVLCFLFYTLGYYYGFKKALFTCIESVSRTLEANMMVIS